MGAVQGAGLDTDVGLTVLSNCSIRLEDGCVRLESVTHGALSDVFWREECLVN